MLIECEPAIKSLIVHLDAATNDIIIEDLDESHLVVKENMVQVLKQKLEDVCLPFAFLSSSSLCQDKPPILTRQKASQRDLPPRGATCGQ